MFRLCGLLVFSVLMCSSVSCMGSSPDPLLCNSSCGNLIIVPPFRLRGDPAHCGRHDYELVCNNEHNRTLLYNSRNEKMYVEAINYNNYTIRVVDEGIHQGNCSSLPLHPSFYTDISYELFWNNIYLIFRPYLSLPWAKQVWLLDCEGPLLQLGHKETSRSLRGRPVHYKEATQTSDCLNINQSHWYYFLLSADQIHWYNFLLADDISLQNGDIPEGCSLIVSAQLLDFGNEDGSYLKFHDKLAFGYELSWITSQCNCSGLVSSFCLWDAKSNSVWCDSIYDITFVDWTRVKMFAGAVMFVRTLFWFPCIFAFMFCRYRRRNLSMYGDIEDFLRSNNNLMPIRYSYSQIRKMTGGLKDKLGEGGFGFVHKGKLRSGAIVAIKILTNSSSNGRDFINEVATIGRVHHTNIVRLIGFCVEGSERALVYEFMPNGSLEKYIFSQEGTASLSCNQIFDISVGVARAIEYLHRGCEMQILHFDIKPHNILLDDNFNPKVSYFGLAKLYPAGKSMVTLTEARGTMGYIAPEMFYKNIGRVSYKADVYSFGMLLLEMAGRRKNLNAYADQTSQIYFPSWVYDEFKEGREVDMGEITDDDKKMTKRMIITAFWCTQMKPSDRPSMDRVLEMLEGDIELLEMPPKPSLNPQEMPAELRVEERAPGSAFYQLDASPPEGKWKHTSVDMSSELISSQIASHHFDCYG